MSKQVPKPAVEWKFRPGVGVVYFENDRELSRDEIVDRLGRTTPCVECRTTGPHKMDCSKGRQ